jgi:curved DNA-binding protein CbpA
MDQGRWDDWLPHAPDATGRDRTRQGATGRDRARQAAPVDSRGEARSVCSLTRPALMVDAPQELPEPSAQGTLAKTPLPHLLVYALERQLSGTIELVAPDGGGGTLLVIDGQPTKARTTRPTAYLGRVLLELGFLTDDQLNTSLITLAERKRLHGQILLEAGLINEEQLELGLRAQLVRKMQALVHLPPDTVFSYYDAFDALANYGGDGHVGIDPFPIVWAAIREEPPWEHVHAALTKLGTAGLALSATAETARFSFDKGERATVELLKGRAYRVHELTAVGTLQPRLAQLLVYCLLVTKQVELVRDSLLPPTVAPQSPRTAPADGQEPPSSRRLRAMAAASQSQTNVARVQLTQREMAKMRGVVEETSDHLPPDDRRTPPPQPSPVAPGVTLPRASASAPNLEAKADIFTKPTVRAMEAVQPSARPAPPAAASAAPKEGPGPLTPALETRKKEILQRAATIDQEDYFQMLGVTRDAEPPAVQAAFFGLAKTWHPDRVPSQLADVKDQCARVFSRLSEAHQTLTDAQKRSRYVTLLQDGAKGNDEQAEVARVMEAATDFQKAEICMKRNDVVQAEKYCKKAIQGDDKQADYHALLAWLLSMKPERQSEDATSQLIADLTRAIAMNKMCERAHFYRGMLLKRAHKDDQAVKDFRRAFELNPRNIDAQREVRLFEMRRGTSSPPSVRDPKKGGKVEDKGGLFGKLFK